MNAKGGGQWKVAYADFVTAMMAFFLVMWITAQDKKIRTAVAHHFNAPYESFLKQRPGVVPNKTIGIMPDTEDGKLQPSRGVAAPAFDSMSGVEKELLRQLNERLLKALQQGAEQGNSVKLELTGSGLNITIFNQSSRPVFVNHSAELTEFGTWVFTTLAWEIARYRKFGMELEGHTAVEYAAAASSDHWALSAMRANTARRVLVQYGVSPDQVRRVSGLGDTKPMPQTPPDADNNNRVTVALNITR